MERLCTRFLRSISNDEHLFVAWGSFGCGFVPTNAGGIRILNGEDPLPAPRPLEGRQAGRQGGGQFAEGIGGRRKRERERERERERGWHFTLSFVTGHDPHLHPHHLCRSMNRLPFPVVACTTQTQSLRRARSLRPLQQSGPRRPSSARRRARSSPGGL